MPIVDLHHEAWRTLLFGYRMDTCASSGWGLDQSPLSNGMSRTTALTAAGVAGDCREMSEWSSAQWFLQNVRFSCCSRGCVVRPSCRACVSAVTQGSSRSAYTERETPVNLCLVDGTARIIGISLVASDMISTN